MTTEQTAFTGEGQQMWLKAEDYGLHVDASEIMTKI